MCYEGGNYPTMMAKQLPPVLLVEKVKSNQALKLITFPRTSAAVTALQNCRTKAILGSHTGSPDKFSQPSKNKQSQDTMPGSNSTTSKAQQQQSR